jgi:hypothetical protein
MWRKFVWVDLIGPYLEAISISQLRATCRDMREWMPDAGLHYRKWHTSYHHMLEYAMRIGDNEVMDFICVQMTRNGCEDVLPSLCQMALKSKRLAWIEKWYGTKITGHFQFLHEAYVKGVVFSFVTNRSYISPYDSLLMRNNENFRSFFEKHYGFLEDSASKKPRQQNIAHSQKRK